MSINKQGWAVFRKVVLIVVAFPLIAAGEPPAATTADHSRPVSDDEPFLFTRLSGAAPGFATYQSHNQLVVQNRKGIFAVFLDSDPDSTQVPRTNSWMLMHSTDGGKTFQPIFHAVGHAMAPTVETDEDDNIYVFAATRPEPIDNSNRGQLAFHRFDSAQNYRNPSVTLIDLGIFVDKFTAIYDRGRQQFYFAPYLNSPFLVIDKAGRLVKSVRLFTSGPNGLLEYPQLALDHDKLYLAWTTATPVKPWRYYTIHLIESDDGGVSWSSRATGPLSLPFPSDDTGPVQPVARGSWLASFRAVDGVLHFMYLSGNNEIYRRAPPQTPPEDVPAEPWRLNGVGISSIDGFFAANRQQTKLYAVGADLKQQDKQGLAPLVVLQSVDNGSTWTVRAKSKSMFHPYAVGGARYIFDGTSIIGIFTNFIGTWTNSRSNEVYFFKVRL